MAFLRMPFWMAVGIIAGMIIGSGMFALPYAIRVSGFGWAMVSALAAFLFVLSIHLAYGEIVVNNNAEEHRLPGYAKHYLGRFIGGLEGVSQIISFNVVLLVYGVLGGKFLALLSGTQFSFLVGGRTPLAIDGWTVGIFCIAGIIFLVGNIRAIGILNFLLTTPLVVGALWFSGLAVVHGSLNNILASGSDRFFAFGVFVFALSGLSVVADAMSSFGNNDSARGRWGLYPAIVVGTLAPFLLYLVFSLAVLSASGSSVTKDALTGLAPVLGDGAIRMWAFIGFLAIITSYLALGYDLKRIYEADLGFHPLLAWFFVTAAPFILFTAVKSDFVMLMSLVGGVFVALDGIMVVFILRKTRKESGHLFHLFPFGGLVQAGLVAVCILSIGYVVYYQILKPF